METIKRCWSKGEDVGITPVKFKHHQSTKQLDDLIYELNDMLYFFSKRYINKEAKHYVLRHLTDIDWERVKAYLNILADNSKMDDVMKAELHKVSSRMPSGVWAIDFNSLQLSIEAQVEVKMSMLA